MVVHADRVLDVRFNTNPRYGAIDQVREETLLRLQSRFAALPGYAKNAAFQGVGRAMYFRFMARPDLMIDQIRRLGPKYRAMARDEDDLMEQYAEAKRRHAELVGS